MRNAAILAVGVCALLPPRASPAAEKQPYTVIVNAANPETTISRERLASLFLKSARSWGNDNETRVLPVDQWISAPVRIAFSKDVFDQPVIAIQSYWQDQMAHGEEGPPPAKGSDREVMAYVEANFGAIGYVSPRTIPSAGTKILKVTR